MNDEINLRILLANRPSGFPKESDFIIEESSIPIPEEGEILIHTEWLSLDPYM